MQKSNSCDYLTLQAELTQLQKENAQLKLQQEIFQLKKENIQLRQAVLDTHVNISESVHKEEHHIDRTDKVISPRPQCLEHSSHRCNICCNCIEGCVNHNVECCGPVLCICFIYYLCIFRGGSEG